MKKSISFLGLFFTTIGLINNANAKDLIKSKDQEAINQSYKYCEMYPKACEDKCRKLGSQVDTMKKVAIAINNNATQKL